MHKSPRVCTAAIDPVSDLKGSHGRLVLAIASQRVFILNIKIMMVVMLFTTATRAFAMNQEGHEDWMADLPHAIALLEAIPEARPLPRRNCPVTADMLADNPYEQIPLPRHRCPKDLSPAPSQAYPASTK